MSLHCIGSLTSRRFLATNRDRKWKSAAVSWNRKAILWDKSGKIPWKPMWKRWVHRRGEEGQAAEGKRWPVWLAWEGAGAGYLIAKFVTPQAFPLKYSSVRCAPGALLEKKVDMDKRGLGVTDYNGMVTKPLGCRPPISKESSADRPTFLDKVWI